MDTLVWLIPAALFLGALGLGFFLWTLHARQYDDLDGAAARILFDDDINPPPKGPTRCAPPLSSSSSSRR
jgi:cbb3-type cytochrome oxidase maturation protein